ncbi:MAG: glycerol-3-phosphate 1-O-acyltransferase [Gammaproteobacteria bacterium]|nr:MAG: glycerol-3-phosphate 1-O-acyltransferase [Gammaproteobacteria bacterium]
MTLTAALLVLAGYLVGSLSAAIITCRLMGLPDPRSSGSRNPGATNVLRLGGRKAAAITLFGDLLKGLLPVLAARLLEQPVEVQGLVGLAAFLGHLYPLFFGFRGGKGVATALGVYLALDPRAGLAFIAIWLIMAALTRISSLSALTASLAMPPLFWWLSGSRRLAALVGLMVILVYWRHRSNIRNLLNGTEGRIGGRN